MALFVSCSCTENELQLREREQQFVIRFSTANVCTEVVTRTASPLTGGTMLRILAFRRIGESPDLSMDRYMGEGNVQSHKRQWCVGTCQFFTATYGNLRFLCSDPGFGCCQCRP